jgi:hypothetical protein
MPLTAEEYGDLSSKIPYFDSNPIYGYLAEKKLLPQQRGLESFEDAPLLTALRRKLFGHTRAENQLIKQQQEAIIPFEQEQEIQRKLKATFDFQQQHAPTLVQASAIMPTLASSATADQQVRPLTGTMTVPTDLVPPTFDIEHLQPDAARAQTRNANYNAYALSAAPSEIQDGALTQAIASGRLSPPASPSLVPPERSLSVYGQPEMDPNARMNPAQLAAYQSMLAGHIVDPQASLKPPSIESATISARGAMEREMLSPAQQKNVLKNMVAAGQLDQAKYEAMLPNLQQPLQKAAFDTFLRELTAGSSTTKSLNDLSLGLFGKNADQIGPDELVTPEDQRRVQQHGLEMPPSHGPMTRQTLLSSVKNVVIPTHIQTYKTEEEIRKAPLVSYGRGSGEMDLPLGGKANMFRRLLPSGDIETAPTTMSHRTANELGYVDTTNFKQDIQAIPDLEVLESQTRELEKYATELITSVPGIGRFIQRGKIALNKLTQGGKESTIPKPDGSGMMTIGEVANLYDTQVRSMLEYYARNLRGVRGAATEGDVERMEKAFASVWDTKTAKEQKFKEVHNFIQEVKDASIKTVFGKTVQHVPDVGTLSESETEYARRAKEFGMSKATVAEEIMRRRKRGR